MSPPLDGCWAKIERANENIKSSKLKSPLLSTQTAISSFAISIIKRRLVPFPDALEERVAHLQMS